MLRAMLGALAAWTAGLPELAGWEGCGDRVRAATCLV